MKYFRVLNEEEVPSHIGSIITRITDDTRKQLGSDFKLYAIDVDVQVINLTLRDLIELNQDRAGQILTRLEKWDMSEPLTSGGILLVSSGIAPLTRESTGRQALAHIRWLRDSYELSDMQYLGGFGSAFLLAGALLAIHEAIRAWPFAQGDVIRTDGIVTHVPQKFSVVLGCSHIGLWSECWDQRMNEMENVGALFTAQFFHSREIW